MKGFFLKIKNWLRGLSFRTGVIVLLLCIPFYILSFVQMTFPISTEAKGVLWVVLFGLAKVFQYGGITILGVEGVKRLKAFFRKRKEVESQKKASTAKSKDTAARSKAVLPEARQHCQKQRHHSQKQRQIV